MKVSTWLKLLFDHKPCNNLDLPLEKARRKLLSEFRGGKLKSKMKKIIVRIRICIYDSLTAISVASFPVPTQLSIACSTEKLGGAWEWYYHLSVKSIYHRCIVHWAGGLLKNMAAANKVFEKELQQPLVKALKAMYYVKRGETIYSEKVSWFGPLWM